MHGETVDTRLARLEEAMISVKGDTVYLRRGLDNFKVEYWKELVRVTGKVAGLAAVVSLIVGTATVALAHQIWH